MVIYNLQQRNTYLSLKRYSKLQGGIHMSNIFAFMDKFYESEDILEKEGGQRKETTIKKTSNTEKPEPVKVSGKGAEEIIQKALAQLEGKETTVYKLRDIVEKLPTGTQKESILAILEVTNISVADIREDAETRISLLDSMQDRLSAKVKADVDSFEKAIKEAEKEIQDNRAKKLEAEELLRNFNLLKAQKIDEVKNILATIE